MDAAPTSGCGIRHFAEALSAACYGNTHSGYVVPGNAPSEEESRPPL